MTFKLGQKIAVYQCGKRYERTIIGISLDLIRVAAAGVRDKDEPGFSFVHPKQCRKLVKRRRRRWTLGRSPRTGEWIVFAHGYPFGQEEPPAEIVDVVEVKRRKGEKEKL